jgi:DNA-binding transcriptional MerR regulator
MPFVPKKLYYKIREVCKIVGVEAHVLRYWETEFPALSPPKSKSGQRTYRAKDIELLLQIRKLLYEDGFTIAGARKRLIARRSAGDVVDALEVDRPLPPITGELLESNPKAEADPKPESERLRKVQAELENILTLLDRG